MDDTMTITVDEICRLASKLDANEPLDDHDQVVMRALLVLAGERISELGHDANEVDGFAFDLGAPGGDTTFGLTLDISKVRDQASPQLFLHCCSGKHFPKVTITT